MPPEPSQRLSREELRTIAKRQKALLFCILVNLLCTALFGVAAYMRGVGHPRFTGLMVLGVMGLFLASIVAAVVLVLLLAVQVHGVGVGVLLGMLTLSPCMGLIVLLVVNQVATTKLKAHGIKVGFMGAKAGDI